MSTDVYAQNLTITEATAPILRFALYQDDDSWSPYTSSAGLEALFVVRDEDDNPVIASTSASFNPTLDADVDAIDVVGITFTTATRTNPVTGTSETVVEVLVTLTTTQTALTNGAYTHSLRVYDSDDDPIDAAKGILFVIGSDAT